MWQCDCKTVAFCHSAKFLLVPHLSSFDLKHLSSKRRQPALMYDMYVYICTVHICLLHIFNKFCVTFAELPTLLQLQDLTKDSVTLTGWRRSHRSGEGKIISLYGRWICFPRYRRFPEFFAFRNFPEIYPVKKLRICAGWDRTSFSMLILGHTPRPRLPCMERHSTFCIYKKKIVYIEQSIDMHCNVKKENSSHHTVCLRIPG